ncbi:MAG: endolytic transglycosylase MltG, partial [Gaiellaceae bacterium]
RRQMAERISAVRAIAVQKRHVKPVLSASQYLAATAQSKLPARFARDAKPRPLEGFLFPATYDFDATTTSQQLVAKQLQSFEDNWRRVSLGYARTKHLTPYDVLIIASMVEKEALAPDDRAKIAAVIYNRLRVRMPLGIDATLRYGLDIPPTKSILQSQLDSDNPYNPRKLLGWPPTPIASPGLASMQAAAHPAKVDYLYFVRKPDKVHHFFTKSYRDFVNYQNAHGY